MIQDGFYDITYATLHGEGSARVRYENGTIFGETDRGTSLQGYCRHDVARGVLQFEIAAVVPPGKVSITGLATGDEERRVLFKGEAPARAGQTRFSIDFAGRAIDVSARYAGPL